MKRAPEKVIAAAIFNKEGVDTVFYANLSAVNDAAMVGKRTLWIVCNGNAYTGIPFASPLRLGVIKHIFVANLVDVGRPYLAFLIPLRA